MPNHKLWKHPDNGRYYVVWTERRRSRRASTGFKDVGPAEKFLANFILELDRPAEAKPDQISIATVLENYWTRHAHKLASAEAIGIRTRHLNKFFGLAAVDSVNARSMERYKAKCIADGMAIGTINLHRTVLRAALRQAVRFGDLATAPFVPSDREPPPRPEFLTRPQVDAMTRAAEETEDHRHVALFIHLAIATGARRGAILQLTWDRVDLKAGTVDFRLPGVDHNRKRRALTALPAHVVALLRRQRQTSSSAYVIQPMSRPEKFKDQPLKSIRRAFRLVAKAAGLPHATPHILKHTAVTWALRVASPWIVSGMTATSMRTLQSVYGKHMVEDLREAAEAVARPTAARKTSKVARVVVSKRNESKTRKDSRKR